MSRRPRSSPQHRGDTGDASVTDPTVLYRAVGRFVLRAPALSAAASFLASDVLAFAASGAIVGNALALAPLGAREETARARRRYLARMAFRPTPDRLFAGAAVGTLGDETRLATGGAGRAHLHVRWGVLAACARALLGTPAVREAVRLRVTPSLLRDGAELLWLARGRGAEATVERAQADAVLTSVLAATHQWTPWRTVRRAVVAAGVGFDRRPAVGAGGRGHADESIRPIRRG